MAINGTFAAGSMIPDGDYKVLVRALKVTGNPASLADYEVALTPEFTIKRS